MDTNTDPQAEAQRLLRATDTHELLTKAYALTHRLHMTSPRATEHAELRAARDLITAEVQRRTALHDMALPHPELPGLTHTKRDRLEQELTA